MTMETLKVFQKITRMNLKVTKDSKDYVGWSISIIDIFTCRAALDINMT